MAEPIPSSWAGDVIPRTSSPRRQIALDRLGEFREVTLADLAELVAEFETGRRVETISPEHIRYVYFDLYHEHLPKLESRGLVTYDQERDLIAVPRDLVTGEKPPRE